MMLKNFKCGLDIDDVLAEFMQTYLNRFGIPKDDYEITRNVHRKLKFDKEFWLNLPVIQLPNFTPTLFCTKRINNKAWTKEWLSNAGLGNIPVYQMYAQSGNKATMIKGRVDVFIDDSVSNMIKMNLSGIPCLLMDKEYNRDWGPVGRIYSLDIDEIYEAYQLLINTVFKNFKQLL